MNENKQQLVKYIFQADYKDGTHYTSTQEDISVQDPLKSCYYDVKQDELVRFFLFNDEHTYSVNLEDGHFEIDGVPFVMHEEHMHSLPNGRKIEIPLKDFRLIFFRQHQHDITVTYLGEQKEIAHRITYHVGWQCTVGGQNYQRVMKFT